MKPAETKRIYENACKSKRAEIVQEEFDRWHRVLREFESRDVEAALAAWWADTTPTQSGRPRGAFLPEPAELKPLVIAAKNKRAAEAREPQDMIFVECEKGHRAAGFIRRSVAVYVPTRCGYPGCGAARKVVQREAA